MKELDLSTDFCGIRLPNPFILAAGPPTNTGEMIERAFKAGWGGAVTKTLALEKVEVKNVSPRLASLSFPGSPEEPKKIYGFENIELISDRSLETWLKEIAYLRQNYPENGIIVSIMADAKSKADWEELAKRCQDAGAQMLELNFSCPHGMPEKGMGQAIGQDPEISGQITRWVVEVVEIPVMVKLTPNITDITIPAKACVQNGARAISAINTVSSILGIDLKTLNPIPDVGGNSSFGGYSGSAIKPIALRAVAELARSLKVPISGIGGISTWEDVVEFILLGASTVQVCTGVMLNGYRLVDELRDGLRDFLLNRGFSSLSELIGLSLGRLTSHESLNRNYRVISSVDWSKCLKDDLCYIACQDGGYQAIQLDSERLPIVDEEKCKGCSLCQQVCPVWDCITMKVKTVVC